MDRLLSYFVCSLMASSLPIISQLGALPQDVRRGYAPP
jgi:hypothetical protein